MDRRVHYVVGDAVHLPAGAAPDRNEIGTTLVASGLETVGRGTARVNDIPMNTKTRYCNVTGRAFLVKARSYLAEDDLLQASENGWGAAAQMVKSIAEARGWPHNGHHELWRVANRLVDETGDRDIRTAFGLAGALHTNFYEGWLPRENVEDYLDQVANLLSKLEALDT
ncbi:MAG: PaREP1 family protein [bacterium]|nr:PaREP1 family protein [bacterium]MDE0437546.1 PaREP1 family protein [bacterium]